MGRNSDSGIIKDENGITYNSFYDTPEELGLERETKEQLLEYKTLVGFPLSENLDDLIAGLPAPKREPQQDGNMTQSPKLQRARKE